MVGTTKLRPLGHVYTQGIIACVAFMTPVFIVLYCLAGPDGQWETVLAVQIVATLLVTLASARYFGLGIWVSADGVSERGFFRRRTFYPLSTIGSVVRARTFEGSSARTSPQLFVCDHDGRQLVRMRGQFWSIESMDVVAATLEVPISHLDDVRSLEELGKDFPGLLYWFERHPILMAAGFAAGLAVVAALVFGLLTIAGVPLGG